MNIYKNRKGNKDKRGAALLMCMLVVTAVAVMSLSLTTTSLHSNKERKEAHASLDAIYIAEAGIRMAAMDIASGRSGDLGATDSPMDYGSGAFHVDALPLGNGVLQLTSTGTENGSSATIQVVMQADSSSQYVWAAFGEDSMTMGSNSLVDSYDSSLGTYASQWTSGSGSDRYALSNGTVGSNGDIVLSGNSDIFGNAVPGPGSSASRGSNATISGSTTSASEDVVIEDLEFPVYPPLGAYEAIGASSLASGEYYFSDFEVDGNSTLTIFGPAVIVADTMTLHSNASILVDATNGDVEFWVYEDFTMNSNTLIAPTDYDPVHIQLFLNADNVLNPDVDVDVDVEVSFDSNAMFFGTILAPNSSIEIDSNFELFGALVARRVHLDSNSRVHFDENLLNSSSGTSSSYSLLGWRIIGN
jgi:hypothetical protein